MCIFLPRWDCSALHEQHEWMSRMPQTTGSPSLNIGGDVAVVSHAISLQWQLFKSESFAWENIIDWQKSFVCRKFVSGQNYWLTMCDGRKKTNFVQFLALKILRGKVVEICCQWIETTATSDHRAKFCGNCRTGLWKRRSDFKK